MGVRVVNSGVGNGEQPDNACGDDTGLIGGRCRRDRSDGDLDEVVSST
jgi:hypothetical protein